MQFSDMRVYVMELEAAYSLSLARKIAITKLRCELECVCVYFE